MPEANALRTETNQSPNRFFDSLSNCQSLYLVWTYYEAITGDTRLFTRIDERSTFLHAYYIKATSPHLSLLLSNSVAQSFCREVHLYIVQKGIIPGYIVSLVTYLG
jgi:hypothetical protein